MVSKRDKHVIGKDWKERKARYTSTSNLLIKFIEAKDNVWTAGHCIALEFCSGWVATSVGLEASFWHPMDLPAGLGWYLLTEEYFQVHCSFNNFPAWEKTQLLAFNHHRAEESLLYVCAGLHLYVSYLEKAWKMLSIALKLKDIIIPSNSVFFDYIEQQHVGSG